MSVIQAVRRRPAAGASSVAREVALHIAYFITGVLVSHGAVLGSLSPFGASFAAAVPFTYLPAGLFGSALSYLLLSPLNSFRYIAVLLSIGAIRWVLGGIQKLSDSRFFPAAVAFVPVFATGVALSFSAGSEITEVYECVIEALLAAAGAYFMSRTVSLMGARRLLTRINQQELCCLCMSGCILLLSFGALFIGPVSVGRTLAVLAVMLSARYGYVRGGSVAGVATGAVFALSDNDLIFLSAGYSLTGLMGGLMAPMGKMAVVFSAMVCNTMMAFASSDRSLVLSVALESAAASAIFLLIPGEIGNILSAIFSDDGARASGEAVRRNVTMRLEHCSRALSNVSSCVNAVSDRLSGMYEPDAAWVYDRAAEYTCRNCGLRVYCWEKERDMTLDDMHRLSEPLRSNGFVKERDIEDRFLKRCCKTTELSRSINRSYREYQSLEAARRRVTQVRTAVAGQFAGLSDILHDLGEEFTRVDGYDAASSERVIAALSSLGMMVVDCACRCSSTGGMTVELELAMGRRTALSKSQITHEVSKACGRSFEAPSISFEGDRARVMMSELPLYDLEIGTAQHICDDGTLCGDCSNYFNNGCGSTVAIISDGMGTGGRAAVDANMAVSIMTRLCKAGLSYDCALAVVNASLMIKSEEESLATMDMLDFNMFTGRAALMKAGACTTYIKKNSHMLHKDMPSLPLGILNEARFIKDDVTLSKDDWIVMVSDGALIGSPDWIEKLIMSFHRGSAEELASHIVEEARRRRINDHDDDITAIAMRVVESV